MAYLDFSYNPGKEENHIIVSGRKDNAEIERIE
jgi:hypothetical protein